jgi:hypothetical protein
MQLPSNGLHNTVSSSNFIVVEACLPRRYLVMTTIPLFASKSLPSNCSVLHNIINVSVRRGADKSLAFPICSTTKRIFLGWVKEVRTTKS